MNLSERTALAIIGLVIALVAVGGCSDSTPLPIGFSGPLQGKYSDLGVNGRNGARLAVEHVNAAGGVGGHPLELLVQDDSGTAKGAVTAIRALDKEGVLAVVGHMTSFQSMASIPMARDLGLTLLSPTTSTPKLSGQDDNFFRVMPSSDVWAEALAEHAAQEMGISTVVTIFDQDNAGYSIPFVQAFSKHFSALGGTTLRKRAYSSASFSDWPLLLEELREANPQALLLVASVRDCAPILRTLRVSELELPVLMAPWGFSADLLTSAGRASEGVISALAYTEDNPAPTFTAFKQAYTKRYGTRPSFAAAFAYESVKVLARALETTGGKRTGLEQALAGMQDVQGVSGDFSIDEFGDVMRPYFILSVKNGKLISLRASGEQ